MKKAEIINSKHVDHIENEKNILERVNHPFALEYDGFFQDNRYIYFATELLPGGDLFTYHRGVGNFNVKQTQFYGAQIASVFEYLHSKDIVYRDLKPENIMISEDGYLKLIDYGFAKVVKKRTYTICGTPEYIAPEILLNRGHSKPVDWWCFGILIYEMHAGHAPFVDDDPMNIYKKIINTKPKYPEGFDSKLKSLVKHLLRRDLSKRFGNMVNGVSDIKDHRFFQSLSYANLLDKKIDPPYIPECSTPSDKESNFLKERTKDAAEVPTANDPFLDW
jgi:serine/threonine protein kinase